ncbi:UDP-glucose/GDP-mannose dehydrogenase family protein [Candidatus Woesebacteria bacterium]|nr:UDP-glucose/GDP-mannose dehydrogenase family protein [Candidatus Woesebacteria bacterium]
MKVVIIGTGFVGVVTAAVLASFGNEVVGVDVDAAKIEKLRASVVPFFEPGLEELLKSQQATGKLTFTTDYAQAVPGAAVVMIAVGTPSLESGEVDLKYVFSVCDALGAHLDENTVVVVKSTVPPGTLELVKQRISAKSAVNFSVASVPEFLKEGTAVADTLHPDRVVIGVETDAAFAVLEELHKPLQAPILRVAPESAQMGKYSANSYLALRIAFINQVADVCETNGADVEEVIKVIGHDARIGSHYWYPGLGYGGSCFPKDVKEIAYYSKKAGLGTTIFSTINDLNEKRIPTLLAHLEQTIGGWKDTKVAVLGLSFKPNTDDLREAPSTKIIPLLSQAGAQVVGFDPQAVSAAQAYFAQLPGVSCTDSLKEAVADADVIIALIEWSEITSFDFAQVKAEKKQYFFDARNQFDREKLTQQGYIYTGIGR